VGRLLNDPPKAGCAKTLIGFERLFLARVAKSVSWLSFTLLDSTIGFPTIE
jgi:hypothetical protein